MLSADVEDDSVEKACIGIHVHQRWPYGHNTYQLIPVMASSY